MPFHFALGHIVQLFFHFARVANFNDVVEPSHKEVRDFLAQRGAFQAGSAAFHIVAIDNGSHNAGVCAGPANTFLFHKFNQTAFGVARRR